MNRLIITAAALALAATAALAAPQPQQLIANTAQQIADSIVASDTAIACQLRNDDWRKAVLLGDIGVAHLAYLAVHPNASDAEIDKGTTDIVENAKMLAALQAKFAAPTSAECNALAASHDMQEMDATAKIGLLMQTANQAGGQ